MAGPKRAPNAFDYTQGPLRTILNVDLDGSESEPIPVKSLSLAGIAYPAGMVSVSLTFMVSLDKENWYPLNASIGSTNPYTVTIGSAAGAVSLGISLYPWMYIKIIPNASEPKTQLQLSVFPLR